MRLPLRGTPPDIRPMRPALGAQHLVVSKRPRATPPALELRDRSQLVACFTEACESTRRDGGWVFPAHANIGEPFGPVDTPSVICAARAALQPHATYQVNTTYSAVQAMSDWNVI